MPVTSVELPSRGAPPPQAAFLAFGPVRSASCLSLDSATTPSASRPCMMTSPSVSRRRSLRCSDAAPMRATTIVPSAIAPRRATRRYTPSRPRRTPLRMTYSALAMETAEMSSPAIATSIATSGSRTRPSSCMLEPDTCESDFDRRVARFNGLLCPPATEPLTCRDDGCGGRPILERSDCLLPRERPS